MSIKKIIRSHDWWGCKVSAFLGIAYATALIAGINLAQSIPWILFILASLVIGASYVSIINDVTDVEQDIAAGKNNYMLKFPLFARWVIIGFCAAIGGVFMYYFYPDKISFLLYLMSWVSFSLYSIPPIRLKTKGIAGVFADACGAHLFPSCLIISSLYFCMGQSINWLWFAAVAIWALAFGLRGILSHQFEDRDKDIIAKVNTYATGINPGQFKNKAKFILAIELVAFIVIALMINQIIVLIFLLLYIINLLMRYKLYNTRLTIITLSEKGNRRAIMNEYYQVFFPISILVCIAIYQPYAWIILLLHIAVFYKIIFLTFDGIFTINVLRRFAQYISNAM